MRRRSPTGRRPTSPALGAPEPRDATLWSSDTAGHNTSRALRLHRQSAPSRRSIQAGFTTSRALRHHRHIEERHLSSVRLQLRQATPSLPHAKSTVPPTHAPFTQQPRQFVGPQRGAQTPASHVACPHEVHARPPAPHAFVSRPVRHCAPEQQPLGQFAALHSALAHWPPLHADAPQSRHAAPPVPHAADVGAVMQRPA